MLPSLNKAALPLPFIFMMWISWNFIYPVFHLCTSEYRTWWKRKWNRCFVMHNIFLPTVLIEKLTRRFDSPTINTYTPIRGSCKLLELPIHPKSTQWASLRAGVRNAVTSLSSHQIILNSSHEKCAEDASIPGQRPNQGTFQLIDMDILHLYNMITSIIWTPL